MEKNPTVCDWALHLDGMNGLDRLLIRLVSRGHGLTG
jgi:hypothetical protein